MTGLPPEQVARLGVARSFQITSLFPQLTAREHIELALQGSTGLGWRFWRSASLMRRYTPRALSGRRHWRYPSATWPSSAPGSTSRW